MIVSRIGRQLALYMTLAVVVDAAQIYSYWVDSTCTGKAEVMTAIQDTFYMAKRAGERLASDSDTDFANVFKAVYKADRSDTTASVTNQRRGILQVPNDPVSPRTFVANIVNSLGGEWAQTQDRASSTTRIYCDDDSRWVERQRNGKTVWEDKTNNMREKAPPSCPIKGEGVTYARTFHKAGANENPQRTTITLCNRGLNAPYGKDLPAVISDLEDQKKKNLFQFSYGINGFKFMVSMTVLHEFTHTMPYTLSDMQPGAYGWKGIRAKNTQDSVNNADNYAYFCLLAALADEDTTYPGWTLARPDADNYDEHIADGQLFPYKDITKRWLSGWQSRVRRWMG